LSAVKLLDHGSLELTQHCVSDLNVVNAARVSLHKQSHELSDADAGLIKFLMREHHGTPFEHGYLQFRVKAPIFVFREWHRHRVGHSYNEWSARYSQLEPEFYIPEEFTTQVGKPGHYTFEPIEGKGLNMMLKASMERSYRESYATYEHLMKLGVSKQQARSVLPVATYSEMIWSCNPRSLMHFLNLRNSANAQHEIRVYAEATEKFFKEIMPITAQAFIDCGRIVP
jgi:thymidylate synthase (FAD)